MLITGAAGGVGRFAVQIARLQGAGPVTALVRNAERGAGLAALGAAVVTELSADGEEFDVIMESVGGPTLGAALGRLASGGTLISIGGSSDTLTHVRRPRLRAQGPDHDVRDEPLPRA